METMLVCNSKNTKTNLYYLHFNLRWTFIRKFVYQYYEVEYVVISNGKFHFGNPHPLLIKSLYIPSS